MAESAIAALKQISRCLANRSCKHQPARVAPSRLMGSAFALACRWRRVSAVVRFVVVIQATGDALDQITHGCLADA